MYLYQSLIQYKLISLHTALERGHSYRASDILEYVLCNGSITISSGGQRRLALTQTSAIASRSWQPGTRRHLSRLSELVSRMVSMNK